MLSEIATAGASEIARVGVLGATLVGLMGAIFAFDNWLQFRASDARSTGDAICDQRVEQCIAAFLMGFSYNRVVLLGICVTNLFSAYVGISRIDYYLVIWLVTLVYALALYFGAVSVRDRLRFALIIK